MKSSPSYSAFGNGTGGEAPANAGARSGVSFQKGIRAQARPSARLAKKKVLENFAELDAWLTQTLAQAGPNNSDRELAVAQLGLKWLQDEKTNVDAVEKSFDAGYCVRLTLLKVGASSTTGPVFRLPQPREHHKLVPIVPLPNDPLGRVQEPPGHLRRRDSFGLTDPRMSARAVQAEVHYCIYCHDHDGDFCSRGFPGKKGEPDKGLKVDPLGTAHRLPAGRPNFRMHALKRDGHAATSRRWP